MSPAALHDRLVIAELDSALDPDCRRVIGAERMTLGLAIESGDEERIEAAASEAVRVAEMWGVDLGAE